MDKTKLNLERLRAYDAEWEEDKHPRAENGQFTSGGSAGSSSGASGTKKYNQNELKPKEQKASKSPLRQAAEAVQGGDGRLKGYKGLSFTQETSEADSGTPAGEVHNFIVGNLKGKEPTKENVTAACKQVVNMLNDDIKYLSERAATARRYGNEQAAKEWEANIEKQQQRIQAAYEVTMGFSK